MRTLWQRAVTCRGNPANNNWKIPFRSGSAPGEPNCIRNFVQSERHHPDQSAPED
jgi:hypothetical protein